MPVNPVRPENRAPTRKNTLRPQRTPVTVGRQQQQDEEDQDHEDAERPELALQVGGGALLDGPRDLLHLRAALAGGENLAHQQPATPSASRATTATTTTQVRLAPCRATAPDEARLCAEHPSSLTGAQGDPAHRPVRPGESPCARVSTRQTGA